MTYIHPTAMVEDGAEIGAGTKGWANVQIRPGARIGEECILGRNSSAVGAEGAADRHSPVANAPAERVHVAEERDPERLVLEQRHLRERRLHARHRRDDAPIRFNYGAFLEQLRLTRARSAAYLNEAHEAVLHAPPPPDGVSLTQRR